MPLHNDRFDRSHRNTDFSRGFQRGVELRPVARKSVEHNREKVAWRGVAFAYRVFQPDTIKRNVRVRADGTLIFAARERGASSSAWIKDFANWSSTRGTGSSRNGNERRVASGGVVVVVVVVATRTHHHRFRYVDGSCSLAALSVRSRSISSERGNVYQGLGN